MRALWELRTLAKRHEIDLFCFCDDPEDEKHIALLGNFCREFYAERLSWFWSRARATSALVRGEPFTTAFFYSRRMSHKIRAAIQENAYDQFRVARRASVVPIKPSTSRLCLAEEGSGVQETECAYAASLGRLWKPSHYRGAEPPRDRERHGFP